MRTGALAYHLRTAARMNHAMTARLAVSSSATESTVPLGGHRAVIAAMRALVEHRAGGVLGVVVATTGSTYRKAGALIVLDANGVRAGALSGGCLEGELEARARLVLASGDAADTRFDTNGDEDRVFGSGTGCGGSTRVLLLPLPLGASPLRDAMLDADAHGVGVQLALATAADAVGCGEARVGARASDASAYRFDGRGAARSTSLDPTATIELSIVAPPRLLLLGAGPETPPLLALTRLLGWRVELLEHRERWRRFADHCGLDHVHGDGPDVLPALLARTRFDAALVMHHNYHLDARALAHLAQSDVARIGLLGPAARRDDLLAEIGDETADRLRPRLHAPVGLRLGGEGAEAIALAIVAELQGGFARHVPSS